MNNLETAFDEALDSAEEAKGIREKVTFRSGELDALFSSQLEDYGPGPGGRVDKADFHVSVRVREVTLPIEDLESITIRGKELQVIRYMPLEGRIDIVAGSVVEEMED